MSALGGDDTICLVVDDTGYACDLTQIKVHAGAGNDTVLNESPDNPAYSNLVWVELGAGSDHFVGADYGEWVFGADYTGARPEPDAVQDTEVDTIDLGGGDDAVSTGTDAVDSPNHDVIRTGPGRDNVWYAGIAGDTIDNGTDPDNLALSAWTGRLDLDNGSRHALMGDKPILTWTLVNGFYLTVRPGNQVAFTGSEAHEIVHVTGTVPDVQGPDADIHTRGGNDDVTLLNYLPSALDMGSGDDALNYRSCRRLTIRLAASASCKTSSGQFVTSLGGVEALFAQTSTLR